jgi:hypothetical protein
MTCIHTKLRLNAGPTHPLAPNPIIKANMSLVIAEVVRRYPDQGILLHRRSEGHCKPIIPYVKEWILRHLAPTPILQHEMDIDGIRRHNANVFKVV